MTKVPRPIRIPLPGLRRSQGLGQALRRVTTALGIPPCSGCEARARTLDRRVVLAALRPRKR